MSGIEPVTAIPVALTFCMRLKKFFTCCCRKEDDVDAKKTEITNITTCCYGRSVHYHCEPQEIYQQANPLQHHYPQPETF